LKVVTALACLIFGLAVVGGIMKAYRETRHAQAVEKYLKRRRQ